MAGDDNLNQDDIEQLLSGGGAADNKDAGKDTGAEPSPSPPEEKSQDSASKPTNETLGQDDIESLLSGATTAPGGQQPAPAAPAPSIPDDTGMDEMLGQNEIENLLSGASAQAAAPAGPPKAATAAQDAVSKGSKNMFPEDGTINDGDVEYLLNQAEEAIESIRTGQSSEKLPQGVRQFSFEHFGGSAASSEIATLDLIKDVNLDLRIELGRTHMYLQDVLKLRNGSVVPLDKLAGDPVDIFVNGRLIAKGEVLVLNDNFCVRIAELIAGAEAAG